MVQKIERVAEEDNGKLDTLNEIINYASQRQC